MANFGERDGTGLPEIRLSVKEREKLANFNRDKVNMTPEEIAEYKSEMVNTLAHEYYHAFYRADTTFPGTPDAKVQEAAAFSTANAITKKYTDKKGFATYDDQSPYPVTPSFGKDKTTEIPKVPELTADEQLRAEQAADLQLKIAIKKAGQIEDALIEGVKGIAQAYRKVEMEYKILGKTVGTEENAKIMEGVWKSIIDNIIAAGGTEADINPQWKKKYKEAHDVLIEMAFQKQELDRLASAATSTMNAEKEVDSANIAVSAVLPGDRVGMMNAMANRDKKLRARDFNKEMVEEEKRHQAALLKARLDMTGKEEEKENQRNARFLARKKFEQEATEAGFDAQLQAATAYEERMRALRENNAVDALGKVFGLGAEQQKYMKLGASRQDRATQEMYAGAGFLVDMNKGMANAQSRNSYTNVLGGFANVGLRDYNRFGKDLNAFDFKNPNMSGNQGILGDDGKPLDWRTMDAQRFINEKLITEAIDKANASVRESKISMETAAGVPGTGVQIGKLTIDNNIHVKFTGKAEKLLEDAGALTSTGGAFGK
jgi:hypothetical protein